MDISVLLVDDERDFCVQGKKYLGNLGYKLTTETDGTNVEDLVRDVQPDVLVLDIDLKLEGIDGRDICSNLCKNSEYSSGKMGIILISGHYISSTDEIAGFEIGADNYLTKPFEMARLAAMINALYRRISKIKSDIVQIDQQLSIDIKRRRILVNNREVQFTRLEFDLLSYLAHPPNTARTKHELFENVWRKQHIEEGAISKCVSLIRKKLSPEDTDRYLKTVFGVGYILKSNE